MSKPAGVVFASLFYDTENNVDKTLKKRIPHSPESVCLEVTAAALKSAKD